VENSVLSGELIDVFFPELLYQARGKRLTGLLRLKNENVIKAIFLEGGLPVFAISNLKNEQLEHFLVASGVMSESMLGQPGLEHGKRLAASLVETGRMSKAEVIRLVQEQVAGIIYSVFDWEVGQYSFDEKARADHEIKLKITFGDMILEGVRRINQVDYFQRALAHGEAVFSPPLSPDAIYQGLNLKPSEAYVMSRVDHPIKARDLVQLTGLAELETLRSAYALTAAGMLQIARPEQKKGSKPAGPQDAASREKDAEKDELSRLKAEVLRATHVFAADDFYEVMGIARSADQNEVKKTYYTLAKKFHPDRAHRLGDQNLREKMEKIFQKISEAYETLADEGRRRSYDERIGNKATPSPVAKITPTPQVPFTPSVANVPEPPRTFGSENKNPFDSFNRGEDPFRSSAKPQTNGSSRPAERPPAASSPVVPPPDRPAATVVTVGPSVAGNSSGSNSVDRAEMLSKRATEALGKGDVMGAVEMLRQAVNINPDDANVRLQLTQLLMKNQRWYKEVEQHYLHLVSREPYNEKYVHMLGNYYKTTGQTAKSQATFRNLLQLNPRHGAALKELKTEDDKNKAKQGKNPLKTDVGGMFSKLFKR